MNPYLTYDSIHLWRQEGWTEKVSPLHALGRWLSYSGLADFRCQEHPEGIPEGTKARHNGHGIPPIAIVQKWEKAGLRYFESGAADPAIVFIPQQVIDTQEREPQVLHIIIYTDTRNPWWNIDLLTAYKSYLEMAARETVVLIFTITSAPDRIDLMVIMMREISQRYNFNYEHLYVDLSAVIKAGHTLKDVPDFRYLDADGKRMEDPDQAVVSYSSLNIPVIEMSNQWASKESLEFSNFTPGRIGKVVPFSLERLEHSLVGRRMEDAMVLEYDYDTMDDAGMVAHLDRMGLKQEYHEDDNRGWVTVAPKSALDHPEKKIPCMLIMQEIVKTDPHSVICGYSLWYEYLNIAAMGDLMLIFFALEDPDSNDLWVNWLEKATEEFPFLDRSRVYMTGHSHNGHYTMEFSRRHPKTLAGIATLGNPHGLDRGFGRDMDEAIAWMRTYDMPTINIDGEWENSFSCILLTDHFGNPIPDESRVQSWQNRLKAYNCPVKSAEEILAARDSEDYATRKLGVPVDHSEVICFEGDECYVGDVLNEKGEAHLRVVTLENWPHATSAHATVAQLILPAALCPGSGDRRAD